MRSTTVRSTTLAPDAMPRPTPTFVLSILPSVAIACARDGAPPPPEGETGQATRADVAVCLQGGPFAARGPLSLPPFADAASNAEHVRGLRWEPHDGCERFVIDLRSAAGVPASSAGRVRAELLRELGVVRVSLLDVRGVAPDATDAAFDGTLARAAYAVRSPDGRWTYVDLHLRGEAEARVSLLAEPARVVVDLRPGGGAVPEAPGSSTRVVVLRPRPGPASYPLEITGYARTFEANVVVRLTRGDAQPFETFTTASAWTETWGHFSVTIPDGPRGMVRLHVGEHSARDGSWEGVAVALTMR